MTKFHLNFNREENIAWLNQMAKEGHAFINYFAGFYTFEECTPDQYEYGMEHSDNFFSVSEKYKEKMSNAGVEVVQCWGSRVYLRRKPMNIPFPKYPDTDDLLEYFLKLRSLFKIAAFIELLCVILELYTTTGGFVGGFVLTLVIGVILIACMQVVVKSNKVILELRERKKQHPKENEDKMNKISLALVLALLVSAAPFAAGFFGATEGVVAGLQLASYILLAVGIVKTRHIWGK